MSTAKKYAKQALPWAVIAVLSGTYYWHTYGQTDTIPQTAGTLATPRPQPIDEFAQDLKQTPAPAVHDLPVDLSFSGSAIEVPPSGSAREIAAEQNRVKPNWSVDGFELTIPALSNSPAGNIRPNSQAAVPQGSGRGPGNSTSTLVDTTVNTAQLADASGLSQSSRVGETDLPQQQIRNIGSHAGQLISNPYHGNVEPIDRDSVQIAAASDSARGVSPELPEPHVPTSSPDWNQNSPVAATDAPAANLASVLESQASEAARIQASLPPGLQQNATVVSAQQPAGFTRPQLRLPQAVYHQIVHHLEYGNSLARRSATLLAKQEFTKGLRIISETTDNQRGSQAHLTALQEGLVALREAEDFDNPTGVHQMDPLRIAEAHDTPIVRTGHFKPNTPSQARKAYLLYAQDRIVQAVSGHPLSAELLYALGKTHLVEAMYSGSKQRLDFARAAALFQCALMVHPNHVLSANELGVILARSGRLEDAKVLFQNAIQTDQNFSEGWRNLAKVHRQLGEDRFAELATYEANMVDGSQQPVTLVNSEQFNKSFGAWGLPEEKEGPVQQASMSQAIPSRDVGSEARNQQRSENKKMLGWLPPLTTPQSKPDSAEPSAESSPGPFRRFGGF